MLSLSVRLVAGQRVRLPSGLSPLVSLLVGHCVPLLVGHCARLVSILSLSPVLSPFLWVIVSVLSPFCFLLSPFLSPFLLIVVSVLSPFCYLLSPFCLPLVGHCVRLVPSVSLCLRSCLSSVSFCLPSCWSLCPPCLPSVSLCLRSCLPSCWTLCPSCLPSVSFCLPSCLPCCATSCWSLCPPCLPSFLYTCLLSPPLACNPSHLSPSCSALQSFTFVSQLWAACRLQSFTFASLCLHLSPSSGLLCLPLPCNPLHLSPALGCCVRLCLAILNFLHLSRSSGRRKLYLQSVPILKNTNCLGSTVV